MTGREKCETTREIRKAQAKLYDIEMDFPECTYEGECTGICPTCKAEGEALFAAIQEKKKGLPEDFGRKSKPLPAAASNPAGAVSYKPRTAAPQTTNTSPDTKQQAISAALIGVAGGIGQAGNHIFNDFNPQNAAMIGFLNMGNAITNGSTSGGFTPEKNGNTAGFCTKCQTKTGKFCPNCGGIPDAVICQCGEVITNINQRFCTNCGNKLK